MQRVSRFRGMVGEVIRQFVSPKTFLSALAILIVFAALHFITRTIEGFAPFVALPVYLAVYAMITGIFSLSAQKKNGNNLSFSSPDNIIKLLSFTMRYLALTSACAMPLALFAWMIIPPETLPDSIESALFPLASIQQSADNLAVTIMVLASLLALSLCLIIATRTETLRETFSRSIWIWLLSERRADLPIFYVALTGGIIVFFGIYLIPFALIFFFAFSISVQHGVTLSNFSYLLVIAASPVLLGRLSAAFVAGDDDLEHTARNILALLGITPPSESHHLEITPEENQASPLKNKPSFDEMVAKTRALPVDALAIAIGKAETSLADHPHDPYIAVELAMLYRKAGETEKSLQTACNAITQAVENGYVGIGVSLFRGFAKERAELCLDMQTLEILGNALLEGELMLDAAWCLHESATLAEDIPKAQEKLLKVASAAEKIGQYPEATALYRFFISAYPDSNLIKFAEEGKMRLEAEKTKFT